MRASERVGAVEQHTSVRTVARFVHTLPTAIEMLNTIGIVKICQSDDGKHIFDGLTPHRRFAVSKRAKPRS